MMTSSDWDRVYGKTRDMADDSRDKLMKAMSASLEFQAEEAAAREAPPVYRYVFAFDCTEEEIESVRLLLHDRKLTNKRHRLVPMGWEPGMPL